MKTELQFLKQNIRLLKLIILFLVLGLNEITNAQEVVVNKYAVENTSQCNQFDVTLEITGAPPVQPLEVVLVIDRSNSMSYGSSPYPIDYAKDAAIDFVQNLFSPANNPTGLNRVAIVSYGNTGFVNIGLTDSFGETLVIAAINSIVTAGATNMEDGLVKADEVLTNSGTFDCITQRNIILLSDGFPSLQNNGPGCNYVTAQRGSGCQLAAIQAAEDAKTTIISGTTYNQGIFTIGLTGALDGENETIALETLDQIQNSGAYSTENNADLTGIYGDILNQLAAAATQLPNQALVDDIISTGFSLVPGSINASKGTASLSGQTLNWFVDSVRDETITLNYTIEANANSCGTHPSGTSRINYMDSSCTETFIDFNNPSVCVPCPEIDPVLTHSACASIDYSNTLTHGGCGGSTSDNFLWEFFLNGNLVGTSTSESGTFTYTGAADFEGSFTANLTYTGTYGGGCSQPSVTEASNEIILPTLLSASLISQSGTGCSGNLGEITVEGQNGTAPYTYALNGGTAQSSGTFSNLAAGSYSVLITDDLGCTYTLENINVEISDSEAPTITAPATLSFIGCDENDISSTNSRYPFSSTQSIDIKDTYVTIGYTASDDINIASITYIDVVSSGSSCPIVVTRTYTVTDDCGKSATATQTISINDNIAPTITIQANDLTVECDGDNSADLLNWINSNGGASASDNCSSITWTNDFSDLDVDCGNAGSGEVT
ncbi:hypothetical protein PK35_07485, partial [Tamlana nanhaiensis]